MEVLQDKANRREIQLYSLDSDHDNNNKRAKVYMTTSILFKGVILNAPSEYYQKSEWQWYLPTAC